MCVRAESFRSQRLDRVDGSYPVCRKETGCEGCRGQNGFDGDAWCLRRQRDTGAADADPDSEEDARSHLIRTDTSKRLKSLYVDVAVTFSGRLPAIT